MYCVFFLVSTPRKSSVLWAKFVDQKKNQFSVFKQLRVPTPTMLNYYFQCFALGAIGAVWLVSFVIYSISFFKFFGQLIKHNRENRVGQQQIISQVPCIISIISISVFFYTDYVIFSLVLLDEFTSVTINETALEDSFFISVFATNIGISSMTFFYLWRLKSVFENSVYDLSEKMFKFLLFAVIFTFLISLCTTITIIVPFSIYGIDGNRLSRIVYLIVYFSLETAIVYLFNKKLFRLIASQRKSQYNQGNTNWNGDIDNYLSKNQRSLIVTATRQTLLSSITIIVLLIVGIFLILELFENMSYISNIITVQLPCVIVTMNMWLSFGFAHKDYKRCCNKSHQKFLKLCQRMAIRRIRRKYHNRTTMGSLGVPLMETHN